MRDRAEDHRLVLEGAFLHLLQHDEIRNRLALAGFSQIWDENPSWYFWLQGIPGAFLLRLVGLEDVAQHSLASYLIHHFPNVCSDKNELKMLQLPYFDQQTATPTYEHRRKFDDHFIVGELGVAIGQALQPPLVYCSWRAEDKGYSRKLFELVNAAFVFFYHQAPGKLCMGMPEEGIESRFAIYDNSFFEVFISEFDVSRNLGQMADSPVPHSWSTLAQSVATCTAQSLCSCPQH